MVDIHQRVRELSFAQIVAQTHTGDYVLLYNARWYNNDIPLTTKWKLTFLVNFTSSWHEYTPESRVSTFFTVISFPSEVVLTEIFHAWLVATLCPLTRVSGNWSRGLSKFHLIFDSVSVLHPNLIVDPAGTVAFVGVVGCIAASPDRPTQFKF